MKKTAILLMMVFVLLLVACQSSTKSYTNNDSATVTTTTTSGKYIANKNSKKLHYYTCDSLPAEHNREYFSSESEANKAGYTDNHKECMSKQR